MTSPVAVVECARGVAAGPDDIDRARRCVDRHRLRAHDTRRAGDLVDGLAAHPQAHQQRAHLRWCRVARHDDLKRRLGLGLAEALAGGDAGKQRTQIAYRSFLGHVLGNVLGWGIPFIYQADGQDGERRA